MSLPKRVLIFGGTHGNEWTGIQVIKHYQEQLREKFPTLRLEFIHSNPVAHELNCRFKDEDLNRAFAYLHEARSSSEHLRAHELKQIIDREECLVLDLHTTTANMGKTVILSDYNSTNLGLCAKLTEQFADCRIIGAPDPNKKYLASQSPYGLILEVGPVANGVVSGDVLESTLLLIEFILGVVATPDIDSKGQVEVYEECQDVHYPVNEKGEITGYIHSGFQGKDFACIKGTFKPFKTFSGSIVEMKTEEDLYPIFINEAAYYPQHLAFTLCRKKLLVF